MKNLWLPTVVGVLMMTGCAQLPNIAPPPGDNPANPTASAGRPFTAGDFLNLSGSGSDIAMPSIRAGAGLPGAPAAAQGSTAASSGSGMKMHGMKMHGMNMPMGAMKGMAKSTEENK